VGSLSHAHSNAPKGGVRLVIVVLAGVVSSLGARIYTIAAIVHTKDLSIMAIPLHRISSKTIIITPPSVVL
jgi:hypothetical protein